MESDPVRRTVEAYDRMAQEYARQWFDAPVVEPHLDRFIPLVRNRGPVADIGCGPGRDLAYLLRHGVPAIGLDLSKGMLEEARRRAPQGVFILADQRHLPFQSQSLAGIWDCASLLHLPRTDLLSALSECARVLRHGYLFLALKEGAGEEWVRGASGQARFFTYHQASEIQAALERAGFEVAELTHEPDASGRPVTWLNVLARQVERSR